MEKAGKAAAVLLTALWLIATASCSVVDFFSADNLLRAPKLTGKNAALQQAFEQAVGKDVFLVSPLTGDHRSAFILEDCNGDGLEEAIVFYVNNDTENTVHMHLMQYADGDWRSVSDTVGNGSEVYKVEFCNIDRDKDSEVAVTWTVSDSKRDKTLSLYKIDFQRAEDGSVFNPLASVQIFDYSVQDFDRDGLNELFYVYLDSTEEKSGVYAKLLKYSETDVVLYPVSEVRFDGRVSNLLAMKYDVFDGKYEVFVDCAAGENTYYTEIVRYEPDLYALTTPVTAAEEDPVAQTRRSSLLYASDINDDGLIEIPVEKTMPDSFVVNDPENDVVPLRYISWQRYEEGEFVRVSDYYSIGAGLYTVCLDQFIDELYMIYDSATGEAQFRADRTKGAPGGGSGPGGEKTEGSPTDGRKPSGTSDLLFTITLAPDTGEQSSSPGKLLITVGELGRERNMTRKDIEQLIQMNG